MAKHSHLTLEERLIIQTGLSNGSTRKAIADTLGKDKSTICKEVKKHSVVKTYSRGFLKNGGTYDCLNTAQCGFNAYCTKACDQRIPIPCKRRDRKVGVCNGCETERSCKLNKLFYDAHMADEEYRSDLADSRLGVNMTLSQAQAIAGIVKDGLNRKLSPYAILQQHPELGISEKTLYNYIEQGVLPGVCNLDLRQKASRKRDYRSVKKKYNKRNERKYLKGRSHADFVRYMEAHPSARVIEMDTVYNNGSSGPFIQTFYIHDFPILFGILHKKKTAAEMTAGLNQIKERIGDSHFRQFFQVILTDRGSEFTQAEEIEALGCRIFYCDPMQSYQKSHVENKHGPLRFILPNEADLESLGLVNQEALDLVFSHLNSYPLESLNGKTAYEYFEFMVGKDMLNSLRIRKIAPEELCMTPEVLSK